MVLSACAVLAGCGTPGVPGGGGALAGRTATGVLDAVTGAVHRAGTVHYVLASTAKGATETISGDAGMNEGEQSVASASGHIQAMLVGGVAYVEGDASGLESAMGLTNASATKYAGQWIAVDKGERPYQSVVDAVLLDRVLAQVSPSGPLALIDPSVITVHASRTRVVGVRGNLPSSVHGTRGTAVLDVSTASPTVPVEFVGTTTGSSGSVKATVTFSDWGTPLALTAPAGAVPFASLASS